MNRPPEMTSVRRQLHTRRVDRACSHQHRTPILSRLHVRILGRENPQRAGLHGRLPFACPRLDDRRLHARDPGPGLHRNGGLSTIVAQLNRNPRFPCITPPAISTVRPARMPAQKKALHPAVPGQKTGVPKPTTSCRALRPGTWRGTEARSLTTLLNAGMSEHDYLLKNCRNTKSAFAGRSAIRRVK